MHNKTKTNTERLNAIGTYCQEDTEPYCQEVAEPYHKQIDRTNNICSMETQFHSDRHNLLINSLYLH